MRIRTETTLSVIWGLMIRVLILVVTAYVLWEVRSVLITVVISAMLAYVMLPAVDMIAARRFLPLRRRWLRLIATIVVFIAFFLVVGVSVKLIISPFKAEASNFIASLPEYTKQIDETFKDSQVWYEKNIPEAWQEKLGKQDMGDLGSVLGNFATGVLSSTLEWLGNIVEIILIPVLAFYFVLDSRSLKREFFAMLPPWRLREALKLSREISGILQSYVIGQLILCIIAGVLTGVVLHLAGMKYALVLAVFAGVTRAIPVMGPVISGVPIVALAALHSMALAAWLTVFVTILHFAESKFIMPILIGDRLKLHPAVILVVLLIGAKLFGLLGMFLAAPVAAIIRELIYFYIIGPRQQRTLDQGASDAVSSELIISETA